MNRDPADRFLAWCDRHFAGSLTPSRLARNTLLLSLAGLAPSLALYVTLVPGFWGHLIETEGAFSSFARQVLTNGLPVVVLVNAFGFGLFAQLRAGALAPGLVLALDAPLRIAIFVALHILIYPGSALAFGSFRGDPLLALRAVGPTLAQAAGFANLSGVYLYATLVSALPLNMALADALARRRFGKRLGLEQLIVAALAIFGAQALLLTGASLAFAAALRQAPA